MVVPPPGMFVTIRGWGENFSDSTIFANRSRKDIASPTRRIRCDKLDGFRRFPFTGGTEVRRDKRHGRHCQQHHSDDHASSQYILSSWYPPFVCSVESVEVHSSRHAAGLSPASFCLSLFLGNLQDLLAENDRIRCVRRISVGADLVRIGPGHGCTADDDLYAVSLPRLAQRPHHMLHFYHGRGQQGAHRQDIGFPVGHRSDELLLGNGNPQIRHFKSMAFEHGDDEVLPDVMEVSPDRSDANRSFAIPAFRH